MRIDALELGLSADTVAWLVGSKNRTSARITGLSAVSKAGREVEGAVDMDFDWGNSIDLSEIIKLLDLGQTKLAVMLLLRRADWIRLLYLLPKKLLINGLGLFSQEKLLSLIMYLPREYLIKMMLFLFSVEELVKKMPTNELMRILRSRKLDNRTLVRGLQGMDPKYLQHLLTYIYGAGDYANMKPYEMWRIFMHTDKNRLMDAFRTLPFKALIPLVTHFVKEDPELLGLLSDQFIANLFDRMGKSSMMQSCMVLPEELIIRMLLQLPDKFLVQVAAQVDDDTFAKYLMANQPDLLRSLAAA
jgi:hypothetical protein